MTFGSDGERALQERHGTAKRAAQFYAMQMLDHLNDLMKSFIAERDMMFVATSDLRGNCDSTLRAGTPGFVRVAGDRTLYYPEFRGNGVFASQGNIAENGHVGLLFLDFSGTRVGLHVNGAATLVETSDLPFSLASGDTVLPHAGGTERSALERWVRVDVHEAYIHCSKHVPRLERVETERRAAARGGEVRDGDFFRVRRQRLGAMDRPASITNGKG